MVIHKMSLFLKDSTQELYTFTVLPKTMVTLHKRNVEAKECSSFLKSLSAWIVASKLSEWIRIQQVKVHRNRKKRALRKSRNPPH